MLGCVWARVRAPLAPRHSWLGCAVWVCVFGLGFRLRPATPGGVLGCACLCACSACTQPLLARVRGLGMCVWARVLAAPRHSRLGRWAVCVLVRALRLHPATTGTGAQCGCVCLHHSNTATHGQHRHPRQQPVQHLQLQTPGLARNYPDTRDNQHHQDRKPADYKPTTNARQALRQKWAPTPRTADDHPSAGPHPAPSPATPSPLDNQKKRHTPKHHLQHPHLKKVPTRTGPRCAPSACYPC